MLPLVKFGFLVGKTLTRPLLIILKKYTKKGKHANLRNYFIAAGRANHKFETWLNHKLMGISTDSDMFSIPLADDNAMEKGIDASFELLIYTLVLWFAFAELFRSIREKKEAKILENKLIQAFRDETNTISKILKYAEKEEQYVSLFLKNSMTSNQSTDTLVECPPSLLTEFSKSKVL